MATVKKLKNEHLIGKKKSNQNKPHGQLVKELTEVTQSFIDLLEELKSKDLLEVRVLDAPKSVWMNPYSNHEWDPRNEEYRIKPLNLI